MSIESVASIGAQIQAAAAGGVQAGTPLTGGFEAVLDQITSLNTQFAANDQSVRALALNEGVNLHEVMMDLERTRLTFDLMLQVRNKLLDAYQELMRMQV